MWIGKRESFVPRDRNSLPERAQRWIVRLGGGHGNGAKVFQGLEVYMFRDELGRIVEECLKSAILLRLNETEMPLRQRQAIASRDASKDLRAA